MRFPLFVDITGRPVTVVGGGTVGCRRAAVLRAFGAKVTILSPAVDNVPPGVVYEARPYRPGDLAGAFLAVAATNDRVVNHAVWREAGERNIPVNVCDCPEECEFYFPAVYLGNDLAVGIAGNGSNHKKTARAAAAVRRVLEELV